MYHLIADYHTHTVYSHGKGTILENVEAARRKGLRQVAITDHGFNHAGFGLKIKDIEKMRNEINDLNMRFTDIRVLLGIESNLTGIDGEIDIPDEYLSAFDIILMGFHKMVKPNSIRDGWQLFAKNGLDKLGIGDRDKIRETNTKAMIKAIEKYPIKIITHPGAKIDIDTRELAKMARLENTALEINASHGFMTAEYAKIALEEGALFVISSDAHTPDRVGDFERGIETAMSVGIPEDRIINSQAGILL